MDWAALMADVLQRLWACPSWESVIANHVSHMVQTLPDNFNQLPAIFALFVLAGFPEVSRPLSHLNEINSHYARLVRNKLSTWSLVRLHGCNS